MRFQFSYCPVNPLKPPLLTPLRCLGDIVNKKIEIIRYILDEMYEEVELIGCCLTKAGQFVGPAINGDLPESLRSQMIQIGTVFQQLDNFPKTIEELTIKYSDYKLILQPIPSKVVNTTLFLIVQVPKSRMYFHREIGKYIKKMESFLN